MNALRRALASRAAFYLLLALGMVALRVLIYDHRFFTLEDLPNHDMSQGAAFFATNVHSLRLHGEPAWWSPATPNGFAQYYQSFLSPLAPTTHHLSFILWGQGIRLLACLGVAVPEYPQYLAMTYVVLPYLAFLAFALFAGQLFRHRTTIFLVCIAYTFSGIGLWNSAWFYFQEPFSLFLFLAACLAALKRPSPRRLLLLLAATLVQLTSFNYWTLYNSCFIAIVLGAHAWTHPLQPRRLGRRVWTLARRYRGATAAVALGAAATLLLWVVLIGSIVREQKPLYIRDYGGFTIGEAYGRLGDVRTYTLELFNPSIQRVLQGYQVGNEMHNARYLGCALLPLLGLLAVRRWGRRERWLVLCAAGVLVICLAPPFLLVLWKWLPMMNRIRHLFYFYTQHWQLLVVLLAAASLDRLLGQGLDPVQRRRCLGVVGGLCALLAVLLLGLGAASHLFGARDVNLQGMLTFALLTLVVAGTLLQFLWQPERRAQQVFVAVLLSLFLADLTRYFWEVSRLDQAFTRRREECRLIEPEHHPALCRPWPGTYERVESFPGALWDWMPITNEFWPVNGWMLHRGLYAVRAEPGLAEQAIGRPFLSFASSAVFAPANREAVPLARPDVVLLQKHPEWAGTGGLDPASVPGARRRSPEFAYQWGEWRYNSLRLNVDVPQDGFLYVRLAHDPCWQVLVDGRRVETAQANFAGTALRVERGRHHLYLEYRPLARRLYAPACLLLEGVLVGLIVLAGRSRRGGVLCLGLPSGYQHAGRAA